MNNAEDKPLFSVILPTYNRSGALGRAIRSVQDQDWRDWELLVVDDGSTDDTSLVVESFGDDRIRYIPVVHGGASAARNVGMQWARGKYLCFLDDDDVYLPHHLGSFMQYLHEQDFPDQVLRTGLLGVSAGVVRKYPVYRRYRGNEDPVRFFLFHLCSVGTLCIPAGARQVLRFSVALEDWEDTHFILRLLVVYPFVQLEDRTYLYYKNEECGSVKCYRDVEAMCLQLEWVAAAMEALIADHPALRERISWGDRKRWLSHQYLLYAHQANVQLGAAASWQLVEEAWRKGLVWFQWPLYGWIWLKLHLRIREGYRISKAVSRIALKLYRRKARCRTG